MYQTTLRDSPVVTVAAKEKHFAYAVDGSLPNPLEAVYAAITACAGVYAIKACKELGISPKGIRIVGRPQANPANPSLPTSFVSCVCFPPDFEESVKARILAAIESCAVKELIRHGAEIKFELTSEVSAPQ